MDHSLSLQTMLVPVMTFAGITLLPNVSRAGNDILVVQTSVGKKAKDKAKAKPNATKSPKKDSEAAGSEPESAPGDDTSASVRAAQSYEALAHYTPASDFVLQYGASFGKALKPNLRLGLTYLGGSKSVSSSIGTTTMEASLSGMAVYGYARYYFGNSFNAFSGLGYRSAIINYKIAGGTFSLDGKLNIQSVTIPLFLGNAWTWKNGLTIGCDWIGAFVPIGGSAKSTLDGNLTSSESDELNQDIVDLGNKLAKTTTLTLLLTSIGLAF